VRDEVGGIDTTGKEAPDIDEKIAVSTRMENSLRADVLAGEVSYFGHWNLFEI